jgi:hypothetical protein
MDLDSWFQAELHDSVPFRALWWNHHPSIVSQYIELIFFGKERTGRSFHGCQVVKVKVVETQLPFAS